MFLSEARAVVSLASSKLDRELPIEFELADAGVWTVPEPSGPQFIFLVNPFGPATLHSFLSNNSARFPKQTILALSNDRCISTCLELLPAWLAWRDPKRNLSLLLCEPCGPDPRQD